SNMTSLMELIRRLHEERLFIKSEQDAVWKLNDEVRSRVEALSHTYWVTRQHYLNLSRLIVNSSQETPALCNRRSKQLDNIEFVDGYKELGYQESMYSQFIEAFINNPTFAAACLAYGDKLGLDSTSDVARTMVMGCYGNNMVADDHRQLLELIETLMLLQLATIEQPSRLLQKGTSAFCTVFKLFAESLWSGKLFLMSALHQPIMEIIMDHELFLETNPQKVLARLSSNEIAKRFGSQDTPAFQEKLKQHVERTEQALIDICSSFVDSLLQTMTCFPQSLRWIISRAFHIVKDAGVVSESEARSLSADFLLHQFVCPAIVNPELYGVTGDVPLSDLTRFNLMQVAQVLQVMAHWNETSQQNDSFYSKLDKGPMRRLIDVVISPSNQDSTPDNIVSQHTHTNRSVFITIKQLVQLIHFLNDLQKSDVRGVDQSTLAEILNHLPDNPPATASRGNGNSGYLTPSGGSAGDLQAKKIFSKSTKTSMLLFTDVSSNGNNTQPDTMGVVLVMSLSNSGPDQQPGTLGEAEVLELQATQTLPPNVSTIEAASLDDASLTEADGLEKRSRFSLYSGGSDLSEVGEELPTEDGISRTSGSSSIDLDQQEEAAVDDESVTHANNDEALKALRRKLPTSRESIEDKMRKFEIRQELGVRFADPGVTDPRSDTWSMDVYASDSEAPAEQDSQSERLDEISEDPPGRLRPSNNGSISSFLALARDEDSRSDVWSVEVLPSDSEPPDIRSEDRLQELESETGTAVSNASEDVMEDNRSRASTPGLSAASGFSGVSGLSLVSDNIQAKASDEQWSHYDRSYGKCPSSISPDADDLINRGGGSGESSHTGGGGSSNSSEPDRAVPSSSSASASPRLAANQSPLLMSSRADGNIRTSASFDAKRVEKSVAWNIPKQEDAPDSGSSPMDFEHINTIKRSPYKKSMVNTHPTHDDVLSTFDPLSKNNSAIPKINMDSSQNQTDGKLTKPEEGNNENKPHKNNLPQGARPKEPNVQFIHLNRKLHVRLLCYVMDYFYIGVVNDTEAKPSKLSSPGEDILQKYRQKVSNQQNENGAGEPGLDPGIYSGESPDHQNISGSTATDVQSPLSDDTVTTATRGASSNSSYHGTWHGTHDIKSRATPATCPMAKGESKEDTKRKKDHLMSFLRGAHAEALMLHDRSRIAHLDEVLRSISQLDDAGCRAILQSMWNDCNHRSSYAAYLIRARQHLLSTSSYLQHMTTCAEMDKTICRKFFTSQCVRIFLKEKEKVVWDFRNSFMRLGASDEKVSLVGSFLSWINSRMGEDRIWEGASDEQMLEAESCVERIIFTYIDKHAMFPNGDGDLLRDQLFHQHISRLSAVLTPLHPSLQVRRKYLKESPWLSAQREARMLSAHRSPRGKLDAALRCCRAVMHLLKLADESEAPGADDFTPVLVFVLIKANPAHLLSTVQYVTSFVGDQLTGEESYWWMQFTAATEFIKTIDERK
uniref:GTPase activating protein and VPS9 domains 1 n=1 Tax=Ciona intestinalis TaxID=7719 RepID=F6SXW5_CIOIN